MPGLWLGYGQRERLFVRIFVTAKQPNERAEKPHNWHDRSSGRWHGRGLGGVGQGRPAKATHSSTF